MIRVFSGRRILWFLVVAVGLGAAAAFWSTRDQATLAPAAVKQEAVARVKGGPLAPGLSGVIEFRRFGEGTLVYARVSGLRPGGFHGLHLHELGDCAVGDPANPFLAAGNHWNPTGQPHPGHAGDLPVLLSNDGTALMVVYTSRFRPQDAIGRSVIIHELPDDYRTQPAGAAGKRLACGVIVAAGK
jgi:Cu-Zn family superoxide dismutase